MISSTLLRSLLFLSVVVTPVFSQSQTITEPQAGDEIVLGEPTTIKWTTVSSIETVGLSICKGTGDSANPDCQPIDGDISNSGSYTWTPNENLGSAKDCWIIMTSGQGYVGKSGNFALESSTGSSTSSSGVTTTRNPSTATPTTQVPATVTQTLGTGSETSSPNGSGSNGPSGAVIGGAIGGAVIVIALALGGFLFLRRRSKKNATKGARRLIDDDDDDVEAAGTRGAHSKESSLGKKSMDKLPPSPYKAPPKGFGAAQSYPLAELPAVQQEPVEMMAAPNAQQFIMELDSREISRPGTSKVHPDVEGVGKKHIDFPRESEEDMRGDSMDGTTVDGDGERPKTSGTLGTVEEAKEEARAGPSERPSEDRRVVNVPMTTTTRSAEPQGNNRISMPPQIRSSIPRLPDFNFDSSKF